MAVLIASDIHGSALYCEQLLDLMKKEKIGGSSITIEV